VFSQELSFLRSSPSAEAVMQTLIEGVAQSDDNSKAQRVLGGRRQARKKKDVRLSDKEQPIGICCGDAGLSFYLVRFHVFIVFL
jgi:hypothetical protein